MLAVASKIVDATMTAEKDDLTDAKITFEADVDSIKQAASNATAM